MNKAFAFIFVLGALVGPPVFFGCASSQGQNYQLPAGVTVGDISGPGHDRLSQALKKRGAGLGSMTLSGTLSAQSKVSVEREVVPQEKISGPTYTDYKPDPFTGRVWQVEEHSSTTELDAYDLQRLTGELIFDWRLTSKTGEQVDQGRATIDVDQIRGGYLASKGLAPAIGSAAPEASGLENIMADELIRQLTLDLGRDPGSSELETGSDSLSRKAKNLADAGQWRDAQALWLELLSQNPNYAPALYNLGLYWERQGDPEEAWRYYRAAFLSEGSDRHRQALSRLTKTLSQAGRLPKRGSAPTK